MFVRTILILTVLTASGAEAQNLAAIRTNVPQSGITVVGRGTAAAVPDRARVSITVFGSIGTPAAGSVPLDEAAGALRDALKANGVTDAREELPLGNSTARNVVPAIVGYVAKPTRERLESIARNVVASVPTKYAPAFANAQVGVALLVDDCSDSELRAERAAFADAKARATRLASAASVRLGSVIAISDAASFLPPACGAKPDGQETSQNVQLQFTSSYGPLVVPVTVNETVVFALAGS